MFERFECGNNGVLDRTHRRFFARHTIEWLFTTSSYDVRFFGANRDRSWRCTLLDAVTLGLVRPFSIVQYIVEALSIRDVP